MSNIFIFADLQSKLEEPCRTFVSSILLNKDITEKLNALLSVLYSVTIRPLSTVIVMSGFLCCMSKMSLFTKLE